MGQAVGLESGRLIGVGKKYEVGADPAHDRPGSTMSDEDLKTELERLRNENAALKKGATSSVRMKVSEKGAVSMEWVWGAFR